MDAAALKATLTKLGETMPLMADQVGEGLDTGNNALESARTMIAEGRALVDAADDAIESAENVVREFTAFCNEQRIAIDEAYEDVEAKIEAYSDLEPVMELVDTGVGEVEGAFQSFQSKLAAGAEAGNAAADAFNEKLEALFGAVEEGAQQLSDALGTATSAFEALQEGLNTGRDAVLSEVDSFVADLTTRQEDFASNVTQYTNNGRQWMADLGQQLSQGFPSMIEAEVTKALDEVQAKVQEQIQTMVREAMDKVVGALDEFADKLQEANEGSQLGRQILEPLFDQFGSLADPLVGALDSIKSAASTVGIDL